MRISKHGKTGYNVDEIYQLQHVQRLNISAVLSNKTFYGDHTSFPGEFILHYPGLVMSGLFKNPAKIDTERLKTENLTEHQLAWVLSPKFITTILGAIVFFVLCSQFIHGWLGVFFASVILAFHPILIQHGLEFRPYGILPELAIFNLFLAYKFINKPSKLICAFYFPLIFLTFIYHAYGILIAGLPFLFCAIKGRVKPNMAIAGVFLVSSLAWCYYASYSTFGFTPNDVQTKVNPFQFMPANTLLENTISLLFGNMALCTTIMPLLLLSLIKHSKDVLFLVLLIVLPIVLIMLVDLKTSYWIHARQWTWVIPFFALFVGRQIDNLRGVNDR